MRGESIHEWTARLDARRDRLTIAAHVVYSAYDEYGVLLYIGCTVKIDSRMAAHRSSSPWHRYMARYECEQFAGLESARRAEAAAISANRPPFNALPEDTARTQANRNQAHRRLSALGIYAPSFDIDQADIDTFEESDKWLAYCAEASAYAELVIELRAELKAAEFPYLTPDDRLALYLATRHADSRAA